MFRLGSPFGSGGRIRGLFYSSILIKSRGRVTLSIEERRTRKNPRSIFLSALDLSKKNLILICLRTLVALIFLQTLFFKFSGAPESVAIFSKLNAEPWGRIGTGVLELLTSILLFVPGIGWFGALLGAGIMSGAILSHLFVIGIEQENDGGFLFFLALTSALICLLLLWAERDRLTAIVRKRK